MEERPARSCPSIYGNKSTNVQETNESNIKKMQKDLVQEDDKEVAFVLAVYIKILVSYRV